MFSPALSTKGRKLAPILALGGPSCFGPGFRQAFQGLIGGQGPQSKGPPKRFSIAPLGQRARGPLRGPLAHFESEMGAKHGVRAPATRPENLVRCVALWKSESNPATTMPARCCLQFCPQSGQQVIFALQCANIRHPTLIHLNRRRRLQLPPKLLLVPTTFGRMPPFFWGAPRKWVNCQKARHPRRGPQGRRCGGSFRIPPPCGGMRKGPPCTFPRPRVVCQGESFQAPSGQAALRKAEGSQLPEGDSEGLWGRCDKACPEGA